MKKVLLALGMLALLASCGGNTTPTKGEKPAEKPATEQQSNATASTNSCEAYYEYLTCAFKKQGLDDAMVQQSVQTTKDSMKQIPADQQAQACEVGMKAMKEQMPAEGC